MLSSVSFVSLLWSRRRFAFAVVPLAQCFAPLPDPSPGPRPTRRCLCQTPVLVPGPCAAAVLHCVVFLIHFPFSLGLIESEAICADRLQYRQCGHRSHAFACLSACGGLHARTPAREKSVAQTCQRLATACCPFGSAEHLIVMTKVIDRAFYDFLMSVDAAVGKRDDPFITRAAAAFMHNEVVTLRLLPNPPAMTHLCVLVRRRARPGRRRPPVFQRRYAIYLVSIHACAEPRARLL